MTSVANELTTGLAPASSVAQAPTLGKSPDRLGRGVLTIFAGPSLPISALGLPLAVYLPEFFANVVGVGLATVSFIFAMVRIIDLSIDPVLGGLMDRTRSRFGRFRPWLVVGAPVVMLGAYMVFMAQPGAGAPYLWTWLLVLYIGYSILTLSHSAWASTLASGYHERSRVYAWMQGGLVLSMVLVPLIATWGAKQAGATPGAGVRAIGWFIIALAPVTVALTAFFTPETVPTTRSAKGPSLMDYVRLAVRPSVSRILLADLFLAMGPLITGSLFFFFFREVKGFTTAQANILLLAYFVGALFGAPLWTWLAKRLGKHRALAMAAAFYVCIQLSMLLVPRGVFPIGLAMIWIAGLAYSAPTIFIRAMMADASDEANLDQGKNSTGMLYAMVTSTAKISSALAILGSFSILGAAGFVPKAQAVNSAAAIGALQNVFVFGPVIFATLGALVLLTYRLDEKRHAEIRTALDARDAG